MVKCSLLKSLSSLQWEGYHWLFQGNLGAVWFLKFYHSSLLTQFSSFITYHSSLKIPQFPMPHPFGTYFQLLITQFFLLLVRPMADSSLKEFCLVTHRTFKTPPFFFTSHFPSPLQPCFFTSHFSLSLLLLFYFHYFLGLCHGFFF